MMARRIVSALAAAMFCCLIASGAELNMGEVVEFPHAGIALAVPQDHLMQNVAAPLDVMRATAVQNGQPVQAVSLAVFPIDRDDLTAESLAEAGIAGHSENLAIRNLQVLSKAAMKVADLEGAARQISYSLRGEETVAATVYFVRQLDQPRMRLCYVLTVEALAERKADVLPTLGEVVKTVRLTALRHPAQIAIGPLGAAIKDPQGRWSIRPPLGWYASVAPAGATMAQTDYLLGQEPALIAYMVATTTDATSAEQQMNQCLDALEKTATQRELQGRLVSRKNLKLAGRDACQIVFEQLPKPSPATASRMSPETEAATQANTQAATQAAPVDAPQPVVIVQRNLCLPAGAAGKSDSFLLVLVAQGATARSAEAMMDKIAEGFELPTPDAAPAPQTAPTTP
jgi:hypothetical protein